MKQLMLITFNYQTEVNIMCNNMQNSQKSDKDFIKLLSDKIDIKVDKVKGNDRCIVNDKNISCMLIIEWYCSTDDTCHGCFCIFR